MVHFALVAQCSTGKISLFKIAKHYRMLTCMKLIIKHADPV